MTTITKKEDNCLFFILFTNFSYKPFVKNTKIEAKKIGSKKFFIKYKKNIIKINIIIVSK